MRDWTVEEVEQQVEGLAEAENRLTDALRALEGIPSQRSVPGRGHRIPDVHSEIRSLRDARSRIREVRDVYEGCESV